MSSLNTPQSISITRGREPSTVSLHYLPCKVESGVDGDVQVTTSERGRRPAEVDCYFEPVIRESSGSSNIDRNSQVLTATFRGRLLKGLEVNVPDGYKGVVLQEHGTVSHDSQVIRFHSDIMSHL